MASIVLRKIAQPQQISNGDILNLPTPLNYKEWLAQHVAIIPNDAQKQYEQYLLSYYNNKNTVNSTQVNNLKTDYITLIQKLSNIFKYDETFQRYANIDLSSNIELKIAIPYYAKKLKELAVYYINHREAVKQNKIEYASIGSEFGLERFLYRNLLQLFTKKPYSEDGLYATNSPDLSAINDNFKITVEELYDTTNYSDAEPLDMNPLLCVLDGYVSNICTQLSEITTDNSGPLESIFLCESENLSYSQLVQAGWEKYLGTDLYYVSGGGYYYNDLNVTLALENGNNFFYWFSGENATEIPDGRYNDTSLSALDWSNATASNSFSSSDLIFVNYGNIKTEAAWLMSAANITVNATMSATISDGREFKFPYPGIGLSAEGGEWTGRLLNDSYLQDKRFFPNEVSYEDNQLAIEQLYWNASLTNSAVVPISIQNLNLEESGAYASNKFQTADKLLIRSNTAAYSIDDSLPNGIYTGNIDVAWLYKFNQTQIPIFKGNNNVYYPLTAYDNLSDLYFEYESGNDLALSAIPVNEAFSGAIAGQDVSTADMIIKLKAPCGPEIEAAWLKGVPLSYSQNIFLNDYVCGVNQLVQYYTNWHYVSGVTQPGIAFIVDNGSYVRFVWAGENIDINQVRGFTGFVHDSSCPYIQENFNSSILDVNFLTVNDTARYEKWKKCTCKACYYSPMGHRLNTLTVKGVTPDFIVPDTQQDKAFNLVDWRGNDGLPYQSSSDLIRFQPNNLIEQDIGWGEGQWVRPSTNAFILETGKSYIYYRTNLDSCNYTLPPFVINQGYSNSLIKTTDCSIINSIPVWYKATQDSNGNWIDTGLPSDMNLQSGSFFKFTHRDSYSVTKQKLYYDKTDITPISGNYITVFRDDPNISYQQVSFSSPAVDFLAKIPLKNNKGYWGQASYNTKDSLIQRNTNDNRPVNDYLQLTQPIPSDLTLSEQTVVRYELSDCNKCFTWVQPVLMQIASPYMHWNRIDMDNCVYSDVLNYIHQRADKYCNSYVPQCYSNCQDFSICGCGNFCEPAKNGVTATNIPVDITLNTELSGIPVFVNYYARHPFNLNFSVRDLAQGASYVPPVSGLLAKAAMPWNNLLNDKSARFLYKQIDDNLVTHKQLGLMIPSKLGIGKYELADAMTEQGISTNVIDPFRMNRFDNPFNPVQINSRKLKNNIGTPVLNKKQTYHPYTVGSTDITPISGCLLDWQTDIFGNQYYFSNNCDGNSIGNLDVKDMDGNLYGSLDYLSEIYNKYTSIFFGSSLLPGGLLTENGYHLITEDGYIIILG